MLTPEWSQSLKTGVETVDWGLRSSCDPKTAESLWRGSPDPRVR